MTRVEHRTVHTVWEMASLTLIYAAFIIVILPRVKILFLEDSTRSRLPARLPAGRSPEPAGRARSRPGHARRPSPHRRRARAPPSSASPLAPRAPAPRSHSPSAAQLTPGRQTPRLPAREGEAQLRRWRRRRGPRSAEPPGGAPFPLSAPGVGGGEPDESAQCRGRSPAPSEGAALRRAAAAAARPWARRRGREGGRGHRSRRGGAPRLLSEPSLAGRRAARPG